MIVDEAFLKGIEGRLCPDIKKGEEPEFYKLMNKYSDESLRHSFSVEIRKCSKYSSKLPCKDDEEIR